MKNEYPEGGHSSDNSPSCFNCVYHTQIKNNTTENGNELNYCTELEKNIPQGKDLGAETKCQKWEKKKEIDITDKPQAGDGGRKAVSSGKSTEHIVGCLLEQRGYKVRYRFIIPGVRGIWDTKIEVDIFCQGIKEYPNGLAIEIKRQDSPGTAFQKIPYEIENIKQKYPFKTILIIDGEYMKKGVGLNAVEWAKKQKNETLIEVYKLEEFIEWVIKEL